MEEQLRAAKAQAAAAQAALAQQTDRPEQPRKRPVQTDFVTPPQPRRARTTPQTDETMAALKQENALLQARVLALQAKQDTPQQTGQTKPAKPSPSMTFTSVTHNNHVHAPPPPPTQALVPASITTKPAYDPRTSTTLLNQLSQSVRTVLPDLRCDQDVLENVSAIQQLASTVRTNAAATPAPAPDPEALIVPAPSSVAKPRGMPELQRYRIGGYCGLRREELALIPKVWQSMAKATAREDKNTIVTSWYNKHVREEAAFPVPDYPTTDISNTLTHGFFRPLNDTGRMCGFHPGMFLGATSAVVAQENMIQDQLARATVTSVADIARGDTRRDLSKTRLTHAKTRDALGSFHHVCSKLFGPRSPILPPVKALLKSLNRSSHFTDDQFQRVVGPQLLSRVINDLFEFFGSMATKETIDTGDWHQPLDWSDLATNILRGTTLSNFAVHRWLQPCIPPATIPQQLSVTEQYAPPGPGRGSLLPGSRHGGPGRGRGDSRRQHQGTGGPHIRYHPNHHPAFREFIRQMGPRVSVRQLCAASNITLADLSGPNLLDPNDCQRFLIVGQCRCSEHSQFLHRPIAPAVVNALVAKLRPGMDHMIRTSQYRPSHQNQHREQHHHA